MRGRLRGGWALEVVGVAAAGVLTLLVDAAGGGEEISEGGDGSEREDGST